MKANVLLHHLVVTGALVLALCMLLLRGPQIVLELSPPWGASCQARSSSSWLPMPQ